MSDLSGCSIGLQGCINIADWAKNIIQSASQFTVLLSQCEKTSVSITKNGKPSKLSSTSDVINVQCDQIKRKEKLYYLTYKINLFHLKKILTLVFNYQNSCERN